jgi:hypothetical protein
MILRAMLAVAYATGRASHARQVKGDDKVGLINRIIPSCIVDQKEKQAS